MSESSPISITDSLDLVWITDLHLSDVPPGRRAEGYRNEIMAKLRLVSQLCHDLNAYCLCGGDVFHVKAPNSPANSPSLIREVIEVFSSFPGGRVYGIVGNHDIRFDQMETLSQQPLGVVIEAKAYEVVDHLDFNGPKFSVRLDGFSYRSGAELYADLQKVTPCDSTYRVAMLHASAAPGDSRELGVDYILGYNQLQDTEYNLMLWGHDHTRSETQSCGPVTHVNLGSLARAAYTVDEADRPVSAVWVHLDPINGNTIKEIPLAVKPMDEVFRRADKPVTDLVKDTGAQQYFSNLSRSIGDIQTSDPIEVVELLTKDDPQLQAYIKDVCNL